MAVDLAENLAPTRAQNAQDAAALRRVFESITAESCPQFYNFHMHTLCSDGRLTPEALIQQAVELGLQGLAITDHHSVSGYRQAQQWLDAQPSVPALQLWTGTEISAALLEDEVHILAYAFDPDHAALQPYLQSETATGDLYAAAQVIQTIHQAGGLAILAHPARYKRSVEQLIPAAAALGIDGIETYYAYGGNPSPWRPSPQETERVGALGRQHALLGSCGTDTHGLSLLQRI